MVIWKRRGRERGERKGERSEREGERVREGERRREREGERERDRGAGKFPRHLITVRRPPQFSMHSACMHSGMPIANAREMAYLFTRFRLASLLAICCFTVMAVAPMLIAQSNFGFFVVTWGTPDYHLGPPGTTRDPIWDHL